WSLRLSASRPLLTTFPYARSFRSYAQGAQDLWYWSQSEADRQRLGADGWVKYLEGKNAQFPEQALRSDMEMIRNRVAEIRADTTDRKSTRLTSSHVKSSYAVICLN